MDETILFFLCIYWWSVYDPSLCLTMGNCKVTPRFYTYSSHDNILTDLGAGIDAKSFWCSDGALRNSWMDLYPHLVVNFGATKKTIVGLALKGPSAAHKKYGFPSFQVYQYIDGIDFYDAIRETHYESRIIKTFTGLTAEDIVKGEVKKHEFPYPVDVKKLKIYFKLRLGQRRICTKIEFYQDPENCGEKRKYRNKCHIKKDGCEHRCTDIGLFGYICHCEHNEVLWIDGLHCVQQDLSVSFHSKERNDVSKAQEICSASQSKLATIFDKWENHNVVKQMKNSKYSFIGVVDVDYDQSYSRWIDGTDVVFDKFEETRRYPGSIGLMSTDRWTFKNSSDHFDILCRYGSQDGYLLTSFYGIELDQLVSSPSLVKKSLASISAFDVKRSLRGFKAYLTTDSGEPYGLFWRPKNPTMKNKFLEVMLKENEIEIFGVVVIGYSCTSSTVKYRLRKNHAPLQQKEYKFSVPAHSEKLQFVKPSFKARRIGVQLDDSADCEGYKWDIVGKLTVRDIHDHCVTKCDHECIPTQQGFYCMCRRNYHMHSDGRNCVKDARPPYSEPKLLALDYPVFKNNWLKLLAMSPTYYEFKDMLTKFHYAVQYCREYGGYLPSIHTIFEHRLMYSDLMSHPTCTKWFLGLNGTSLMHSAWQDGSWVDFALFEGTVPEHTDEEQVVFMDKELFYMWNYGPASTIEGCFVCQYKQLDCTRPILTGPYQIPKSAWKAKGFTLDDRMLNNILLDLRSGLQYFETNTADSYIQGYGRLQVS
ncbi:uncharacterized protein LOC121383904 [Gigantopelta aegis]|uniref:uncharacterized protein LOC121383904 n=1 Tax=Gigantopelta aegis TaxID=1735272 RepID=UPI001B8889A7|nr:uncharacterized protein LOC121383904 [Gigantopelta aegis]